jgi:TatD DNase family protein
MKLFDTHAHITDKKFDGDRQELIDNFEKDNVIGMIEAGTDIANSKIAAKLAEENNLVYAAAGVHPHNANETAAEFIDELKILLNRPKVVAVGEIGLDFHYDFSPREIQKKVFYGQLCLARDMDMPVILHSREATKPMMDMLKSMGKVKGVMHCFSGSEETAIECAKLGLHISFTGTLTFPNASNVRDAFMTVPLDKIMAETDCPYLSPVPKRGKRNEPKYVKYVLEKMAELREISVDEMGNINTENAKTLFDI